MADLIFGCTGASADRFAVTPTLSFQLAITERSGVRIHAIALRCQIRIEPHRRRYSATEAERLHDLFGDTSRWADTVKPMQLATVTAIVPSFSEVTEIDLPVPCTYDLEVASARYLQGLDDGTIPLLMLFSGTVFVATETGFSVELVPWSAEASYRMPVTVWRDLVEAHFPGSAWLRCSLQTLDALAGYKARNALPTWDATLNALLAADRGPGRAGCAGPCVRPGRPGAGPGEAAMNGDQATMNLDAVRGIADAVLYEGYILYPYRASSQKNQSRWQFGVVMAPGYAATDPSERTFTQAECVLAHTGQPVVRILLRFLQVQRRTTEGSGQGWDEAAEREIEVTADAAALLGGDGVVEEFAIPGGHEREPLDEPGGPHGTGPRYAVRRREPLAGAVSVRAIELPGPWRAVRLQVRVENRTAVSPVPQRREDALPSALVAAHTIISVSGGEFISMTDPPIWRAAGRGRVPERGRLAGAG